MSAPLNPPLHEEMPLKDGFTLRLTRIGGRGILPIVSFDPPAYGTPASFRLGRAVRVYEALREWGDPKLVHLAGRTDPLLAGIAERAILIMDKP